MRVRVRLEVYVFVVLSVFASFASSEARADDKITGTSPTEVAAEAAEVGEATESASTESALVDDKVDLSILVEDFEGSHGKKARAMMEAMLRRSFRSVQRSRKATTEAERKAAQLRVGAKRSGRRYTRVSFYDRSGTCVWQFRAPRPRDPESIRLFRKASKKASSVIAYWTEHPFTVKQMLESKLGTQGEDAPEVREPKIAEASR